MRDALVNRALVQLFSFYHAVEVVNALLAR
jgi:hypothetical protein